MIETTSVILCDDISNFYYFDIYFWYNETCIDISTGPWSVWTLPCKPCKACEQAPARAKSHVCEALPGAQLGRNLKVGFLDDDQKISFGYAVSDIIDYSRLIIR